MVDISKLEGLKRQAQRDGWSQFIRTVADEKAMLKGHTFSWDRFDHYRYFVESRIKLIKGQWGGQPMKLLPWHEEVAGSLFGWIKPDGLRRFRRGYVEVPKKNSKTTLFSTIALYMLEADGESSPEVYVCANAKEQAAILWGIAAAMVQADEKLSDLECIPSTKRIVKDQTSFFAAWSSDVASKDGPDASCILVDELHEWKGRLARDFWGKIRYAGVARSQPFCPLIATTAGDDRYSLCWEQRLVAKKVLDGISEDLVTFAAIWAADPEKIKNDPNYWKTEECHREANPAYGDILKKEDFDADCSAVENDPKEKARFLRYRLNVWIDSDTPWLGSGVWEKNQGPGFEEEDLHGLLAYGGLDMSSIHDFTASSYVLPYMSKELLPNDDGVIVPTLIKKFRTIARIYCPEDTFAERVRKDDSGSLRLWYEAGFIRLTPGDSIDHETIFNDIEKDCKNFQVKQFAYDRNSAAWIVQEIQKKIPNIELFPFNQSMSGMSAPTKALTASLMKGQVEHNGNPVLAWMASNAVVETNDAQENMMLHKGKSKEKIDGIVAMIMAYNQAELGSMTMEKKFSPYSNEGFEAIKKLEGIKDREGQKK